MNYNENLHLTSQLIHPPRVELPEGNTPLVSPIHQSVKYLPRNMAHLRNILTAKDQGYLYSRIANPTVRELEILLAKLQGRDDAIATASGIAALTAVAMTFLRQGDRVVVFTESYKPTRFLLGAIMSRFGIETIRLSRDESEKFAALCRGSNPPKMVFLESPTNPCLRLHDLREITRVAKAHGCLSVLDNTFAGFLAHGGFEIDLFVHSLTKQACGHSDAMGGVVIARGELIQKLFPVAMTLGACLDPNSAWLIMRGMKTYALRTRESSGAAHEIARWLEKQPWAEKVRYPALPSHPDHALWQAQGQGDGGSVITFDLRVSAAQFDAFFDSLKLFSLTPSLGCVESLVAPCMMFFGDDLPLAEANAAGISNTTVRLAIGLENTDDLKSDLTQAAGAARQTAES